MVNMLFAVKCVKGKYPGKYLKRSKWMYDWSTLKSAYLFKSVDDVKHLFFDMEFDSDWVLNDITDKHTIDSEIEIVEIVEKPVETMKFK